MAMPASRRLFDPPHQKRVLLMLGYYEHRMHLGVARYTRQANWILDTTMVSPFTGVEAARRETVAW
jgi:hypothetical protein